MHISPKYNSCYNYGVSHQCHQKKALNAFVKCECKSTTVFHFTRVFTQNSSETLSHALTEKRFGYSKTIHTHCLFISNPEGSCTLDPAGLLRVTSVKVSGSLQLSETQIQLTISQMLHFPVCISGLTAPSAVSLMLGLIVP